VPAGTKVLDLGCAGGYMGALLQRERGCQITGVDMFPLSPNVRLSEFIKYDLNVGVPDVAFSDYSHVLLLDVIEHLASPEAFLDHLRDRMKYCTDTKLILSTPNVGFFIVRIMLLFGQFNYGKRGILDLTHKRLFTFSSLHRLLEQRGFGVAHYRGIPAPYPVALGDNFVSRFLLALNSACLRVLPSLFSYFI
jgi:2-polyprenyl-3-methyl-5-hydroxy-6-metoxy-1,4-benzoquinol methylase